MSIFNITFLILLFTKSSVECGTTHHLHRITRHSSHKFRKSSVNHSSHPVSASTSEETAQDFPCNTFMCLIEKYEVMKTSTGFLLKSLPSQPVDDECTDLPCWLNRFKISKTSYGYQLTNKAVIETSDHPTSTSTPPSTTKSMFGQKSKISDSTVASVEDFEQIFDDHFY